MHLFNMATLFIIVTLVGVEFSVSAFVNPAAWRLDPESQLKMLGRFAFALGQIGVARRVHIHLHHEAEGREFLLDCH